MNANPPSSRRVWLLSPYHTGSHRAWGAGYQAHSRHAIELLTMAGRFWKWRMQGGAVELAAQARRRLAAAGPPECVIASDMVNLPAWLALLRGLLPATVPIVLYMHENQLTYPWRPGEKPDLTYAMINWLSQLSATRVLFNSHYHLESWFAELPRLLKHFPDYNHLDSIRTVQGRSHVLPVGIEVAEPLPEDRVATPDRPPLVLWNQRWEYDKQPEQFFGLLYRLAEEKIDFRLAVAGENFRNVPAEFERARERLAANIVHWGYIATRTAYRSLLGRADLVISTAAHEFFGISVLEAVAAGAFPLLPQRLSYPELVPETLHPACLYRDEEELILRTRQRLLTPRPAPPSLRAHVLTHYGWPAVAARYDDLVDELCVKG